jgi:hypothetical protein
MNNQTTIHPPHSPHSLAPKARRVTVTHSPRPYVIGRAGECVCRLKASRPNDQKPGEWPPAEYALPYTLQEIEQGRIVQGELFAGVPDDSRAGRLQRILAGVPGVVPGDRLPPRSRVLPNGLFLADSTGNRRTP